MPIAQRPIPRKITNGSGTEVENNPKIQPRSTKPEEPIPQLDSNLKLDKLSWKQRRFLAFYLADPDRNPRKAALKAGYSAGFSQSQVWNLLKEPQIAGAINEIDRKSFKKLDITHERILQELAVMAFANIDDYLTREPDPNDPTKVIVKVDVSKTSVQSMSAVKEIGLEASKQRVALFDKLGALERLGKFSGLFSDPAPNPFGTTQITINLLDAIVDGSKSFSNIYSPALPDELKQ
jgi:phage terminase small subunit